ncbi:MAG: helix-turn-helix transcriptional regulator [Saprospiraceae bacterium]|nr:helix-turn-helix transcriptional regulator [Saprospiraceae bacterium]
MRAFFGFWPPQPVRQLTLVFCLFCTGSSFAQADFDLQSFRTTSDQERYRMVHHFPFSRLDSAAMADTYEQMYAVAAQQKDTHTRLALAYYKFRERKKLRLSYEQITALLATMEQEADAHHFAVERAVAHHFAIFEDYDKAKISREQVYAAILLEFEEFKNIGFVQFQDYDVSRLLFHLSRFMYDLDDFDKALEYLNVAERFIQPVEERWQTYILVLNYIQTIYQKQKAYPQAVGYAKKILQFCQNLHPSDPDVAKNCRIWEGIASIDIASMLVEQHRVAESEPYVSRGYELAKAGDPNDLTALQAEYDALQVLISIKLELGLLDETARLLQRVHDINAVLDATQSNYLKHIRFYQSCAKYYHLTRNFTEAFRYLQNAQTLQDSLQRRNDAWKYQKIEQRFEAERYVEQLSHLEREKQLQQRLRNATLLILVLVLALGFVNYFRLRAKKRQALAELRTAQNELQAFAQSSREKSELVDSLRNELEKLSSRGERSDYLEQLSRATILTEADWQRFRMLFEKVHPDFIAYQKAQYPDLTPAEIRLLALEKLNMSTQEMANMLGVAKNTINQTRVRLRRKINSLN